MRFFSLQFYEKFFRVSQSDVIERVTLAFIPIKRDFIEKIRPNPDFYGPFWILTTLIFLLSSTGNLSRYFENWEREEYIFKL
jgi:protein YIPF1/2